MTDWPEAATAKDTWWTMQRGASPVVGTAIHNGHALPPGFGPAMAIGDEARLREEDPYTEYFIRDLPNRIVAHHSRFAVDLNRARDLAMYLQPEQSWGVRVFAQPPTTDLVGRAMRLHDLYYRDLRAFLRPLEERFGCFVVLDVHSYNHRRDGPDAPAASADLMPQVNIGTFSMDRRRWAHVVDPFMERLRAFEFRGRPMDVRENVAFQGRGEQTRFIHHEFPTTGCAIAVEFKKFFMDEWTGEADHEALDAVRAMVRSTLPLLEDILGRSR
jgi:N-formylglutamate amidohydrolase